MTHPENPLPLPNSIGITMIISQQNSFSGLSTSLLKLSMLCWILLTVARVMASGDQPPWQEATSDDGQIRVLYRLTQQPDLVTGKPEPTLEYHMTYTGPFDLETAVSQLEDIQKLKFIEDVDHAEILEQSSADQRLVYFYSEGQWPIPGSDVVARMTRANHDNGDQVTITLTSEPNALEPRASKRFNRFFVTYTLEQLDSESISVTIAGEKTPPFRVPQFLLKRALPSVGFEQMDRYIELLNGNSNY